MMDKKLPIILSLLCASFIYCKEECQKLQTHTFQANPDSEFSFKAEIIKLDGLVIDINYEEAENDRIDIAPKESSIFQHDGDKYIQTSIDDLDEGLQDICINVGTNTLYITCASSEMTPVIFRSSSKIKNIKVAANELWICEESCSTEKKIERNINKEETLRITAFITSENPITFDLSNPREDTAIRHFEMKPGNCSYKQKQDKVGIPCEYINQGWNKLNIFVKGTALAINNIEIPVGVRLKTINISGSYLVNCTKGTPVWKISSEEVAIPVFFGQEIVFSLTSTVEFSPVFHLAGNKLTLSWNNGLKFDSSGDPLHPNTYNIICNATSKMLILYNENKSDVLMELKIENAPQYIMVSSVKGEYEISISIEDQFQRPEKPTSATTSPSLTGSPVKNHIPASSPKNPIVITFSVLIPVAIIIILVIAWKKTKRAKEEKLKAEGYVDVSTTDSSETSEKLNEKDNLLGVTVHTPFSSSSSSLSSSGSRINMDTQDTNNDLKSHREVQNSQTTSKKEVDEAKYESIDRRLKDFGKNKPVIQVVEELDNVINSVFEAMKDKQLYGKNSADSLLRDNGLPGNVRDNQGNSLLHYLIFPAQQDNQTHEVNAEEIKKILSDHKVFANAVNYKGQTPLHVLVIEASKGHSKNEWENMAQLLLDVGCDPRIHDNNGQLPEDIALYRGCIYLQTLLKETRMDKGEITKKSKIGQWPTLLKGTKENDIESVRQLLLDNIPILPFSSSSDPLRVAIQRENIELTMLLLCAGAPLCGRTLIGLNPLEVSHSIPELNKFLPALIRREFYNCLRSESEMLISNNDSDLLQLNEAVIKLSNTIKKDGHKKVNWSFSSESKDISERSKEARKMLRLAASKGMGLTCQMIGLEDVFLHPLPLEISPDNDAKPNTLVILCRDLELSLSLREGNIPSHLKEEYEEYNFKKLRDFCEENAIILNSLYDKQTPICKKVLKYIAEQGLDITYKKISRARNGQLVDLIVDPVTGFTMLHSAAYNGRMGMVEYLLLNKASDRIKTYKGFTAAHVAAMRGHRECMEYILAFSNLSQSLTDDKTNSGLTAHQISDGYASEINNLSTFLLHENVSDSILSEPKFNKKAKLVLKEKKSTIQDCLSKGSLDFILPEGYINEHKNIWQQLKEESENFVKKLKDIDSRFSGKTINHHRNDDALELLLMDSYQIYLEVDNNEYWKEKNLHEAFIKSGYKALENYTVKSKNFCLVPPVFKPTMIGANIFVSYCSQQITTHISIHVIPILKENLNLNTEDLQLSKMFNDTIAQTTVTHIAHTNSGERTYVTVDLEKQLFAKVDSSKLLVLSICRFIKKILYPHWWFPRIESRRHGRQWHHYAVSLQSVPDRLLISCFLWEIFNVPEEKWSNDDILERIIGVYEKMVVRDRHGRMIPSPNASCFLDPGKTVLKVWPTITVIIDFLKELNM